LNVASNQNVFEQRLFKIIIVVCTRHIFSSSLFEYLQCDKRASSARSCNVVVGFIEICIFIIFRKEVTVNLLRITKSVRRVKIERKRARRRRYASHDHDNVCKINDFVPNARSVYPYAYVRNYYYYYYYYYYYLLLLLTVIVTISKTLLFKTIRSISYGGTCNNNNIDSLTFRTSTTRGRAQGWVLY
jgi:hypothetical protein